MGQLKFDKTEERTVNGGVSQGILFLRKDGVIVPWNGLISVSENPSGSDETTLYADNQKYGSFRSAESYNATIESYSYPSEFPKWDGKVEIVPGVQIGQQGREQFDFCFRTEIVGSNVVSSGYKLHLVYNATMAPGDKSFVTSSESSDASKFSWELTTLPFVLQGLKPTSKIEIDSVKVNKGILREIESILYGLDGKEQSIPSPEEVLDLLKKHDVIRPVVDILSAHSHWIWDTFNFTTDTVPDAIERESLRHIYYNPSDDTTFIQPSVAYYFLSENSYGVRHFKFVIIDNHYPSQLVSDIEAKMTLTKVSTKKEGDYYYYTYDLYI